MKKLVSLLTAALLLVVLPAALAEGLTLEGAVQAGRTLSITAPYSGTVGDFTAKAGDAVSAGEALFAIATQKVYAEADGTVTGLFAAAGDSAQTVQERYGALCYIEDDVRYKAVCTNAGADGDIEDRIVHAGEAVYIKSTQNTSRKGEGIVTAVSAEGYTVEITRMNDLNLNESVKIYRDSDYDADSCIGSGRTAAVPATAVNATGSVLRVCVSDGQHVRRGDLLFEIVPDALDGLRGGDGTVTMPEDGVLLSVSAQSGAQAAKDAVLATYCPAGELEVICPVDEDDLSALRVGARVSVMLDALPGETLDGTLEAIAHAPNAEGSYDVTVSLRDTENVRIGMSATVTP